MSRDEKIGKLARAIRRYRGAYNTHTGKWLRAPEHKAGAYVRTWLFKLDMADSVIEESMDKIDGLKTHNEFNAWISKL